MQLVLKGVQRFWFHPGLIALIRQRESWEEARIKDFLSKNNIAVFNQVSSAQILSFLEDLEKLGFVLRVERTKESVQVLLAMAFEQELESLKREVGRLSSKIQDLETAREGASQSTSVRDSEAYRDLAAQTTSERAVEAASGTAAVTYQETERAKAPRSGETQESSIGKYWLARAGIFTLALGIVLFISYSFQFIGAWGKLAIGAVLAGALIGFGNYLSSQEKYRRWSMATIGGGWAILYFVVYAAYQIAATRVIHDPVIAFICLLFVMSGSITQSLKFKSAVLVFFSYFLAYVAVTLVGVTTYTLAASFLLGVSTVIVAKRVGWTWLALLGLVAVYLTHYAWVSAGLFGDFSNTDFWYQVFISPWGSGGAAGGMPLQKSLLHQGFLALYWMLFAAMGFIKTEKPADREISFWLLFLNNLIFCTSYLYHLHAFHPALKYWFPLVMGFVFLALAYGEEKRGLGLFSDLYLAFGTTLFSLAVPMYFHGPSVTYGWSGGLVILTWLGVRHRRMILYRLGWALAAMILCRLLLVDHWESGILFRIFFAFRTMFLIHAVAALAFGACYFFYKRSDYPAGKEREVSEDAFLIGAFVLFAAGCHWGGLQAASSVIWVLIGMALMFLGVRDSRVDLRKVSMCFFCLAAIRIAGVDGRLPLLNIFTDLKVAVRLSAVFFGILGMIATGGWLRRQPGLAGEKDVPALSQWLSVIGALLLMVFFYDPKLSSWIAIIWGVLALGFLLTGFYLREKLYRWIGLGMFGVVLCRLFFYDFGNLETPYRIISFVGLGVVLLGASFLYSYCSKLLLDQDKEKPSSKVP
ncbi:MAG TPA: DUF2339 domain-containing protein [Candidatus Omnitrophota bacterium]|nr:DUF2339 domain-containing protein [Candidatus Omnitrophota bacterium]HPS36878.1 DUF2339 domain-containing protein [Candidatus Omnitrophota bacterium]